LNPYSNDFPNFALLINTIVGSEREIPFRLYYNVMKAGEAGKLLDYAHKISTMHEYILVFANNYERIKELEGFGSRKKPNAKAILAKAKQLYGQIGKKVVPAEVRSLAKVYGYPNEIVEKMKVEYDLDMVNREFDNWLKKQDFSSGEKAYKFIDENGRVYQHSKLEEY